MSLRFLSAKLLRALVTLWLAVTFVFVVLRVSGDPVLTILPDDSTRETIDIYRRMWGLDLPIWQQYFVYFENIFRGTLGRSFLDGADAVTLVLEHVPKTLMLTGVAFALMLSLGVPAGVWAALHRNKATDRVVMAFAVSGYSVPNFFLGIILILIFSVQFRILPSGGSDGLLNIIMPAVTMGTSGAGVLARFTRSSMLEVLGQPYVRAAMAKGLPWHQAVRRHALPNAAIPTITVIGFMVGGLIGGALITETVFAWPGIGRLLVNAVALRDLAVVQVIILMVALSMVIANLTVDLLYGWLDPRVRAAQEARQ